MPNPSKIIFKLKIFIAVFLTPILSLGFFVAPARAEWASHLVISAAQITEGEGKTNHDFIEIYNPTLNDINLKGYRLVKRTKIGASDTSIKSWTDDTVIKAHGWRLWASSDDEAYSLGISADDATKQTIASDNGIAIRFGAMDAGEIIDSVAWGAAENIFKESSAAPVLGASEVLARKQGTASEGNGEDTNNNINDFIIITNFIPRNSQSIAAPAIENGQTPDLSLAPNSTPIPDSGSGSAASALFVQKRLPQAEAGADKEAIVGETIDFDGSDSFDPEGKEMTYNWDFGDGAAAKGSNASHAYKTAGEYAVVLKVNNGANVGEDFVKAKISDPEFSDKIILSEMLPNPIGADKDGEWIELFNSGDKKINLRGWTLASSAKTSGKQYVFSGDNFIEAKSFLTVTRSESGLALTNESGSVSLASSADKILSQVSYGAAKEGQSYALINSAWQWTDNPTMGKENLLKSTASANSGKKENKILVSSAAVQENPDNGSRETSVNAVLAAEEKTAAAESAANLNSKNYSDILASEAGAEEAVLGENISTQSDNSGTEESPGKDKVLSEKDADSIKEKDTTSDRGNIRNNPWFYGDIMLSILSLFLVWRYQEIRKKMK